MVDCALPARMLKLVRIRNFAVVTEASIELGPGLNLLTGETGSGKSIFVEAIALLLGARASSDVIRTGSQSATVQGVFDVSGNLAALALLSDAGIEAGEGELILRREISEKGRGRAFANDVVVTTSLLRDLRPFLVDIHGQGDQQTLLDPGAHVELLDEFADVSGLREEVARRHAEWSAARAEADSLNQSEAERLQRADVLAFQLSEIERAAVKIGEDDELERERQMLVNAERIIDAANEAYVGLYDAEGSVLATLAHVDRKLESLSRFDERLVPYVDQLRTVKYTLDDLAQYLRDYLQEIDFSADRLRCVEDRLQELDRLKRKYGGSLAAVRETLEELSAESSRIFDSAERRDALTAEMRAACDRFIEVAHKLSKRRKGAAARLEESVLSELRELAMEETRFSVEIRSSAESDQAGFKSNGIDQVEFLVATNPGDELRPLARIASGGETSRLMLALKTVSAPPQIPRTLIFDEIDVGIGGRVAESIGHRLARLSRANQVLCVTHQAQIARFADVHYSARKDTVDDRAVTRIELLDGKGQVDEIARMIGGTLETARRHARELLRKSPH